MTCLKAFNTEAVDNVIWMGISNKKLEYFKPGWPFLITNDSSWHFIKDSRKLLRSFGNGSESSIVFFIELPKNYEISDLTEIIPLNQFNDKFENEEIINYVTRL